MSDNTLRSETISVSEKDDLGQGDILRLVGSKKPPHMGVIINADCDLANGKTDGIISYLPLYSLKEYLSEFWIVDFLASQKNQIISNILCTCAFPRDETDTLARWLHDDDNADIAKKLADAAELNQKSKARLEEQVGNYISVFCECQEPNKQFKRLCARQKNPDQYAQKQVHSAYKQMGDGHLVVNELLSEAKMGFVVRMRRIYSLDEGLFFKSERHFLTKNTQPNFAAIRVCKLSGVFQFKLAQLFAYQFSRVGLPDEFREMHSLVLDDVANSFSEEPA